MAYDYKVPLRDQLFLLPPSIADWLPEEHLVGLVLVLSFSVAALGVVLQASGGFRRPLGAVLTATGTSEPGYTGLLRVEGWKAAVRMANDRPLVGVGPDGYLQAFEDYRSVKWLRLAGRDRTPRGAHNVALNYLATHGYPGLLAFLAVLAAAGLLAARAWRRLRRLELLGSDVGRRAREARLVLSAVVGGLVAYLVQASFNVQQIALTWSS